MGGVLKPRVLTLLVLALMLGFSQIPVSQHHVQLVEIQNIQRSGTDPGVSDLPTWRVGDKWIYSGTFDPSILIADTGVSASVGEIRGDSTAEVIDILELQFDSKKDELENVLKHHLIHTGTDLPKAGCGNCPLTEYLPADK